MNDERLRIAIVSSPRSGNTWIRSALAGALGATELAAHNFQDAPNVLPERVLFQIHWYREPNFQQWLTNNHFMVLTIARHPLDVLLSALRFAKYEPDTEKWLGGNTGLPGALMGATPWSAQFINFARSFEAETLLSVTYQWWHDSKVIKLRYEDVVGEPVITLGRLVDAFGGDPRKLPNALHAVRIEKMQNTPKRHGWHGRPGLWRELITTDDAKTIWRHHRRVFETLGYSVGNHWLTRGRAVRNWEILS